MKIVCFIMILAGAMIASTASAQGVEIWREDSFEDFRDGVFGDGGANTYVSARGRIQTVNRWDANGDGYIDIAVSNSHPSYGNLDTSVYWGDGKDYSILRQNYIPANSSHHTAVGDFNGDGHLDLAFVNSTSESYVLYGGLEDKDYQAKDGEWAFYPFASKVKLATEGAADIVSADLDRDGRLDLVFAQTPVRIYKGTDQGFVAEGFEEVPADGAMDVAVADLNDDGWLDLVVANRGTLPLEESVEMDSFVYLGGAEGFSEENRLGLPTIGVIAAVVADVDNDGDSDIVFANESGDSSYAYLNDGGYFSSERRIAFTTHTAHDCIVADFDNDGFADVFFTNHHQNENRLIDSYLYYGSADGFTEQRRQGLPTMGAMGVSAGDLNEDGWIDLVISNFQDPHAFDVPSYIYWNSPTGFERTRRTPLYEHGAAGNAIVDLDGDGHLDVLILSMVSGARGTNPNYVYWGNKDGLYSADRRLVLPCHEGYEHAMGDLNDDG